MVQSLRKVLAGVGGLAALGLGGAAVSAAATSSSTGTTAHIASVAHPPALFRGPVPGTAAHEDAEKPVTGAAAAKARAAAVKSVGGGTAGAVTTDITGKGFETRVTKPNGSTIQVHLDRSYRAIHGPGGPGCRPPAPFGR